MKKAIIRFAFLSVILMLLSGMSTFAEAKGNPHNSNNPPLNVTSPAEFDKVTELIIRWPVGWSAIEPIYINMVSDSIDTVTVNIVVDNTLNEAYVKNVLSKSGITYNVTFTVAKTDTVWIRDYGPNFVIDSNGVENIVDLKYFTGRKNDDKFPERYGVIYNENVESICLSYEGGNYMCDGNGVGFTTTMVYNENQGMTTDGVNDTIKTYFGLNQLVVLKPLKNEGTGHIDMFAKIVDNNTIIVGQYPESDENYQVLEDDAAYLTALGYEVLRVPMLPGFKTYTNSLILNNKVLIPTYNTFEDEIALTVYSNAMPGYEIIGIDCSNIIDYGGAIHCIAMTSP